MNKKMTSPDELKIICLNCKKEITSSYEAAYYPTFCSKKCFDEFNDRVGKRQISKNKFEEIKKMAWEFYKEMLMDQVRKEKLPYFKVYNNAWQAAEEFYNFAKEKEGEMIDEPTR